MEYIQSETRLGAIADRLAAERLVAVDTEAAGFHRYLDRVCLLQLSTRTETWVVDTLVVQRLSPLAGVFADPEVEIVLHDADYDLRLLARDFGLTVRGLFDTRIAAQFLGEPAIGLANLVEKYVGLRLDKKHQRADWAERPLPAMLLEYAAEDTRHLLALRDRLRAELAAAGRLGWAQEEFRLQEAVRWDEAREDGDPYLRIKGGRDLRPRQLAALRGFYDWRERLARARDKAPFRVLSNAALLELSRRMPQNLGELAEVSGVPRRIVDSHGAELLEAVRRAQSLSAESLPTRPRRAGRPAPDAEFDRALERLRSARDRMAAELGLDRGFLLPRLQLEELARRRSRSLEELNAVPGLRRWQIAAAGEALISALRR
ncbi:MAG: ribonuclease D [Gemmatimonadetes bacterium]|nr:ribonuclease D [Gemmatimonadota bacterium]